jgi:hypothetical protein
MRLRLRPTTLRQRARSRSWHPGAVPLAAVVALGLAGCARNWPLEAPQIAQPAAGLLSASQPDFARLVLRLDGLWGKRTVQFVGAAQRVKVTITGPDLATPYENDVNVGADGQPVPLEQVPVGAIRVVTLRGLDAGGHVVRGTQLRVAGELGAGLTTLGVSRSTTIVGDVVQAILDTDSTNHTQVLKQMNLKAVADAVAGYARALSAPDPALLDASAIAYAIYHANGVPPLAAASLFLRTAGTVVLQPHGWPPHGSAIASLDDPLSQPMALDDDVTHVLGPVAPGAWTLTITPQSPGLVAFSLPVTVVAGAASQLSISFGTGLAQPDMPKPIAAAIAGSLPIAGQDTLVVSGGATTIGSGGPVPSGGFLYSAGLWSPASPLIHGVANAATAVFQGRLYAFGGLDAKGPIGEVIRVDAAMPDKSGLLGAFPAGRLGYGAAAGAIEDLIYVAGGTKGQTPTGATLAYNANAGQWQTGTLPDLPVPRINMAAAATGGQFFVFGGLRPGGTVFDGPDDGIAMGDVSAFTPGTTPRWEVLPAMPTPRSGAAAVVAKGLIWVIGGASAHGAPSGAVEVYNPTNKSWSLRPPLQVPRAFAAAGLVNGKIVVAGGAQGPSPLTDVPVAAVEVLTP